MASLRTALQAAFGRPPSAASRIAFHGPLLAGLDDLAVESRIAVDGAQRAYPALFPNFHARCGDQGLEVLMLTNPDLECERTEPKAEFERPPQCYPLQSSESWTELGL